MGEPDPEEKDDEEDVVSGKEGHETEYGKEFLEQRENLNRNCTTYKLLNILSKTTQVPEKCKAVISGGLSPKLEK
jgi:hypothetical protein